MFYEDAILNHKQSDLKILLHDEDFKLLLQTTKIVSSDGVQTKKLLIQTVSSYPPKSVSSQKLAMNSRPLPFSFYE